MAHGIGFIPTAKPATWDDISDDWNRFSRRIYCHDFFSEVDSTADTDKPPAKFRIPNPSWHPKTSGGDYQATQGVEEYVAHTRVEVKNCIEDSHKLHAIRPEFNLQKRHRDALTVLRSRRDIIFVDADKNLGLVCLDAADYERRCIAELAQTHHE